MAKKRKLGVLASNLRIAGYDVKVDKNDEGTFIANVSALTGCVSQGDTYQDVVNNITWAMIESLSVEVKKLQEQLGIYQGHCERHGIVERRHRCAFYDGQ